MAIETTTSSLSLSEKILFSQKRIREFYNHFEGNVYISFSGGKDSTVLLDIARKMYPDIKAVFMDTGLEYPEVKSFVNTIDNLDTLKPKLSFLQIVEIYGYPVVSKEVAQKIEEIRNTHSDKLRNKRLYGDDKGNGKIPEKWKYLIDSDFKISSKCCNYLKKNPVKSYEHKTGLFPIVGTMAEDSVLRMTSYLKTGCNSFESKRPMSLPLAIWTEEDIWQYLTEYNIPYSDIYLKGYRNTGCMFCLFGMHLEKRPNKFDLMKDTHPQMYKYLMEKLNYEYVIKQIMK